MIPKRIVLHNSDTKDSGSVSWGAIRWWHTDGKHHWPDIGYHFGIEEIEDAAKRAYIEVLLGRLPNVQGAHTKGHNFDTLGICFVGSFEQEPPPPVNLAKGLDLVEWLCRVHDIHPSNVFGHRELASYKTCPGSQFDLDAFRFELLKRLG